MMQQNASFAYQVSSVAHNTAVVYAFPKLEMTPAEIQALAELRDGPRNDDDDFTMLDNVLSGAELMDVSHAGGELELIVGELSDELWYDIGK
jgi:hypothetical protein